MSISVVINGKYTELAKSMTLLEYLEGKGLAERRLAVAHNGDVVPRGNYADAVICEGDVLEIVRPVGGG